MKNLITALLIAIVAPVVVPFFLVEKFCKWFHWPYLLILTWPLCIFVLTCVWCIDRSMKDNFEIPLLDYLKMELVDMIHPKPRGHR